MNDMFAHDAATFATAALAKSPNPAPVPTHHSTNKPPDPAGLFLLTAS